MPDAFSYTDGICLSCYLNIVQTQPPACQNTLQSRWRKKRNVLSSHEVISDALKASEGKSFTPGRGSPDKCRITRLVFRSVLLVPGAAVQIPG